MMKRMLRIGLMAVVVLTLLLAMVNGSAFATDYSSQIKNIYTVCKNRNGGSFSGYCGRYVLYQLDALGIGYVGSGS